MNWNSQTSEFTAVVKVSTKVKRDAAILLAANGMSVADISVAMGLSGTRIRELLR